jgi:N-acetylmuramoyl-L-alanine amidase
VFRLYVKLLASAAGLVCVLALAAAAPATARPVDFELAPTEHVRAASGGGVLVSKPLTTPRRFNLVGMRWRGRAQPDIELRVRSRGRWSRWAHLGSHASGTSDPIWVGRAGAVQYRLSRPLPGLRLHFVDLGRRALSSARPARRRARGAAAPPFPYVSRAAWGASACPPRTAPTHGEVRAVHVHHTVSLNDYTPEEGPAIVLAVCRFHRNSNGWSDIGYNMLVDKYGVLYEGRAGGLDKAVIGAQAQGFNAQTAGISNIGDHTSLPQTPEALSAMATYIRWKLPVHGQPLSGLVTLTSAGGSATKYPAGANVTLERVIGHRDTGRTACPGEALYTQLAELRTLVETGVPLSTVPAARVSATIADSRIAYGELVPVGGTLVSPDGLPVAGEVVDVQVNNQGRWRTVNRVTTDANGAFGTEVKPRRRSYLRVRWRGSATLRGASSARLLVHVSPLVSIDAPLATGRRGERLVVSGVVAPRKRFVHLVLQQRIDGRYRRVGVRRVRARRGRFSGSFVPAFATRYRYFVVVQPDLDTDRAVSQVVDLRVAR